MGFLVEVVQDVLCNLSDTVWVQQGLLVLSSTEFLLILLALNGLELGTHIVVVHLELQHLFIANGIGDHIRVQLAPKHAGCGFCPQCVLGEDGSARKAKLAELLELLLQVLLRFTKLAAVALVKDKHHLLVVDRQVGLALHQVVELLDGGDNDLVVVLVQIALQPRRAVRAIDAVGREPLVLLHGLEVQILAVHHKEHLVDERQLCGQPRCLKAGQGLARTRGVPDKPTTFHRAPVLGLVGTLDLPQNALCRGNLVGAHHQQRIAHVKHRVVQQHIQQRVFLEERGGEVLQVLDPRVV